MKIIIKTPGNKGANVDKNATKDQEAGIIDFDGNPGRAAKINYSVPLPGSHTGRRILELDVGINKNDWLENAKTGGTNIIDFIKLKDKGGGIYDYDPKSAVALWTKRMESLGTPYDQLASVEQDIPKSGSADVGTTGVNPVNPGGVAAYVPVSGKVETGVFLPNPDTQKMVQAYLTDLSSGVVSIPSYTWAGVAVTTMVDLNAVPSPSLFLVEYYGISSFLGDYGLGRTVKTFTLLPGESTTISMRTWRATKETFEAGSSIIDSHHTKVAEKFGSKLQKETTDKATNSKTESWHAEAEAKASWGFGSAKVSGGGAGEYHSGREHFAKQVGDTTRDHANEASAAREMTVTSSSEQSAESEDETVIERTIRNINVRRTLNFVFRELNQEYITKIHLKDVRVAFTNGRLNTWREVPLSGLRGLLQEVLIPSKVDSVAKSILKLVGVVFDYQDSPVKVLETLTISGNERGWQKAEVSLISGEYSAPTDKMFYRFKHGPLAQAGKDNPVEGVLMKEQTIVMRTDSVVVEALLGKADALDPYAMEIQAAAARAKTLENERQAIANEILQKIADPEARAEAYNKMFNVKSEEK